MSHSDSEPLAKKPRLDVQVETTEPTPSNPSLTSPPTSPPTPAPSSTSQPPKGPGSKKSTKRALRIARQRDRKKHAPPEPCSPDDVLWHDVIDLVGQDVVDREVDAGTEFESPFVYGEEVTVRVVGVSCAGMGMGFAVPQPQQSEDDGDGMDINEDADMKEEKEKRKAHWPILIPFTVPHDTALVRIFKSSRLHSLADLLSIPTPTPSTTTRDNSLVQCKYFTKCGGCQYQMVPYAKQLEWKREVIVRSYKRFSGLLGVIGKQWDGDTAISGVVPRVGTTIPSPLQYGYRTKITPHFDRPPHDAAKVVARERAAASAASTSSASSGPTHSGDPSASTPTTGGSEIEDVLVPSFLKIGFNQHGSKHVLDIEECAIATPVINRALPRIRNEVARNILSYKKAASLLLRDSLPSVDAALALSAPSHPHPHPDTTNTTNAGDKAEDSGDKAEDSGYKAEDSRDRAEDTDNVNVCITNPNSTITERVGPMIFTYPASSFFQNNNSVLPDLVRYVRDAIFPSTLTSASTPTSTSTTTTTSAPTTTTTTTDAAGTNSRPTHLVDAYCGSGLFAISLAPDFDVVSGIELSAASITSAKLNAQINQSPQSIAPSSPQPQPQPHHPHTPPIPPTTHLTFTPGTAHLIFSSVSSFPRTHTALIIDPPRKGCDDVFLGQLVEFGAEVVVYVSCNVVTQARDVGWILGRDVGGSRGGSGSGEGEGEGRGKKRRRRYVLESLRGFDLFPQTAHVESVAVLRLRDVE